MQALQASMAHGGPAAGALPEGAARGGPAMDPDAYAAAMTGVLQNPQFMQMAEQLGQQIMTVRLASSAAFRNLSCTCEDSLFVERSLMPAFAPLAARPRHGGHDEKHA